MKRYFLFVNAVLCVLALSLTAAAAPPYPNTFKYQDVEFGCTLPADNAVEIGSRRHILSFAAEAGQTVDFELEFTGPESDYRGAELWIYDDADHRLAHAVSWYDPEVTLSYTFAAAGDYLIYVSHADFWGLDGTYAYQLTPVCDTLCAQLWLESTEPGYEGISVYQTKHFDADDARGAWDFADEVGPTLVVTDQNVELGRCCDLVLECDAGDPQVCAGDVTGGALMDDVCAVRDWVHDRTCEWSCAEAFAWYSFDVSSCPQ